MSNNQHEPVAIKLWNYFTAVINWVQAIFPNYRKEMKGVEWGFLYNDFSSKSLDPQKLEEEIVQLMRDEDATNKKGIYQYVLTRNEKYLSIRKFTDNQIREAYERQKGFCPKCKAPNNEYELKEMEADHIKPWSKNGKTNAANCQMLCRDHNRRKSDI
jgi:hypothetical protein